MKALILMPYFYIKLGQASITDAQSDVVITYWFSLVPGSVPCTYLCIVYHWSQKIDLFTILASEDGDAEI